MAKGKCAVGVAGGLMILTALAGGMSAGSAWWASEDGFTTLSLWNMEMTMEGYGDEEEGEQTMEAKHDDMCNAAGLSAPLAAYCLKIRVARGTTISTCVVGFVTAILLLWTACGIKMWKFFIAIPFQAIVVGCAAAAIAFGLMLERDNNIVSDAKIGFVSVCLATAFSFVSLVLSIVGLCSGAKDGSMSFGMGGGGGHKNMETYDGYGKRKPVGLGLPRGYPGGNRLSGQQAPPQPFPPQSAQGFAPPAPVSYGQAVAPPPAGGYGAGARPQMVPTGPQPAGGQGDFGLSAAQPAQQGQGSQMPPLPKTLDYY